MNPATSPITCPPSAPPEAALLPGLTPAWHTIHTVGRVVITELYRRKDFYVLFILTALITLVMGSVNFFNEDKTVRYLKEISLLLIWIAALVIAVTTTARQIPAERENRTIFPLLAKPVTRGQLLLGKFWGCWLATGLALAVFYVFFGLVSAAREHTWPGASYFQALTLHWFMLGVVCGMALLGSVVFAAPSSNNTIVLVLVTAILLLGRHLNKVALSLGEPWQTVVSALYFCLPHLELFDVRDLIIHNWGTVPWLVWAGALGYAAAWTGLLFGAACLLFRRTSLH